MKQLLIGIICISFIFLAGNKVQSAETATERGSVMLGGAISFGSINYEEADDNVNVLLLAPSAMVFVTKGFAIGPELSFLHQSQDDVSLATHRYTGKLLYIAPMEHALRPFVEGGFGFIRQSYDYDWGPGSKGSENGWTLELGLGMYAFLNEHYAIVTSINYLHDNFMVSQGDEWKSDTVSFSVGFAGFVF